VLGHNSIFGWHGRLACVTTSERAAQASARIGGDGLHRALACAARSGALTAPLASGSDGCTRKLEHDGVLVLGQSSIDGLACRRSGAMFSSVPFARDRGMHCSRAMARRSTIRLLRGNAGFKPRGLDAVRVPVNHRLTVAAPGRAWFRLAGVSPSGVASGKPRSGESVGVVSAS